MITVLSGGVGAARFLSGLLQVRPPSDVTAIVNTGDDVVLHGLHISPDLDTVTYTLAGAINPEAGWGLVGESWQAMDALQPTRFLDPQEQDTTALIEAELAALADTTGSIQPSGRETAVDGYEDR